MKQLVEDLQDQIKDLKNCVDTLESEIMMMFTRENRELREDQIVNLEKELKNAIREIDEKDDQLEKAVLFIRRIHDLTFHGAKGSCELREIRHLIESEGFHLNK